MFLSRIGAGALAPALFAALLAGHPAGPADAAEDEGLGEGLVNPGFHSQPAWFKSSFLDLREDVAEAGAEGRRVLLYFYQDGCPYCARLLQDNLGQKALAERTRANFDVIAINIWGDREVTDLGGRSVTEKTFSAGLGVQFTPTLLFLDENGAVALRINGYFTPHKYAVALDYAAPGGGKPASFRTFLAERAPAPASGELHPQPFFSPPPHQLDRSHAAADRPLAVLFEQRACPACDELHTEAFTRPEVRAALERFQVVQLDMWSDTPVMTPAGERTTARQWADRLGIQYAPTLVFFDVSGREVFRNEAYLRPFHLVNGLRYVADGAYREQPSFQRYLQGRTEAMRERGESVDLWE